MQKVAAWAGNIAGEAGPEPSGAGSRVFRGVLMPLFLVIVCPPVAMLLWFTHVKLGGSLAALFDIFRRDGVLATVRGVWGPLAFGSCTAWTLIGLAMIIGIGIMFAVSNSGTKESIEIDRK